MAFLGDKLQDVFRCVVEEMARAVLTGQDIFAKLLGLAPAAGAPAGSAGGILGALLGGGWILSAFGLFRDGGLVGDGRVSGYAPAAMFAVAPRFHGGGRLAPDEMPMIGQLGTEVLTKYHRRAREL
ncbi:MAG: hypothetical protein ACT6XS_16995 [Phreatobacter sp.]|uniref:hypothetical protein n=1 Tax=Phreatobacter sp. TaxID=1966341 RepID=UPI004036E8F6